MARRPLDGAASRTTAAPSSGARPGKGTSHRPVLPALFRRKQPDLNWENPEVRHAVPDDALVARPGRRRLPHGRHQFHLQGRRGCPMRRPARGASATPLTSSPTGRAGTTSSPRCTTRFSVDGRPVASPSARCQARHRTGALNRPGPGELNMVFQFEHMQSTTARRQVRLRRPRPPRPQEVAGRWQDGLAETGWNSLYWDNHDQPRVVPGSATTTPNTGRPRRRRSRPFCTACVAPRSSIRVKNSG